MSMETSAGLVEDYEVVVRPRPIDHASVADLENLHDPEDILAGYPSVGAAQPPVGPTTQHVQVANDVRREDARESHTLLRDRERDSPANQRTLRDRHYDDELLSQDTLGDGVSTTARSNVPVSKLPPLYASLHLAPIAFFYGLASGLAGPVIIELLKSRVIINCLQIRRKMWRYFTNIEVDACRTREYNLIDRKLKIRYLDTVEKNFLRPFLH